MLEPLFDRENTFVGWADPAGHIFDSEVHWVAFISNGHAWSPETGNWLGPVRGLGCYDRAGQVVAWCPRQMVTRLNAVPRPSRSPRPLRPIRPLRPVRPLSPVRPLTANGAWSSIPFHEWLSQQPEQVT